jgi:N-acetylmuramoyl-L-alanine amidase
MTPTYQSKLRLFRVLTAGMVTALAVASGSGMAGAVAGPRTHVVRAGETLTAIGRAHGVPLDRLIEANSPLDPHRIFPGDQVILPAAPMASSADPVPLSTTISREASSRSHVVQLGETASAIARSYGIPLKELARHNNLADPNRIRAGQRLEIPELAVVAAMASVSEIAARPIARSSSAAEIRLDDAASRHGLDPALVRALAWQRSRWNADLIGPGGERGLLQISPTTLAWVEQSILRRSLKPETSDDTLEGGAALLSYLLKRSTDEKQALAAFMQGLAGVQRTGIRPETAQAIDEIQRLKQGFSSTIATSSERVATPAGERRHVTLEDRVLSAVAQVGSPDTRVGVAAVNLTTGERLSIRGAESFSAASVLKLPIMVEVHRQIAEGILKADPQLNALVREMIVVSDNQAANRLVAMIGRDNLNASLHRMGLTSTQMHNPFGTRPGDVDRGFNQTSPDDMIALLGLLADEQLVNAAASKEMRALLAQVRDGSKIRRPLSSDVSVAHKSGWFEGVSNDVGIVRTARGTYLIAVFAHGPFGHETGNQIISAVSSVVYDAWGRP